MTRWTWLLAPCLTALTATSAHAAWPASSDSAVRACPHFNTQRGPCIAPDGSGGVIVAWVDSRNYYATGDYGDIFAQHVLVTGQVDPRWPPDGRAICTASGYQELPVMVCDSTGGAIVAWDDYARNAIYAHHVLNDGTLDPHWPANGLAVSNPGSRGSVRIVSDGTGGAIVTWMSGQAQHVLRSGVIDPSWPAGGVTLGVGSQPFMVQPDGAGGEYAIGTVGPEGSGQYLLGQHVLASGSLDGAWPTRGFKVTNGPNGQYACTMIGDGGSGALVLWCDWGDSSPSTRHLFLHHLLVGGTLDAGWPAGGVELGPAGGEQWIPDMVGDGAGGAIVVWTDFRVPANRDLYGTHVLANGALDPAWSANGELVCGAPSDQGAGPYACESLRSIVSDGAGGALAVWGDSRDFGANSHDVYAGHLLANGTLDPLWPFNGLAVATTSGNEQYPAVAPSLSSGAIVAWESQSTSGCWTEVGGTCYHVYAQRVTIDGQLGPPTLSIEPGSSRLQLSLNAPSPNPMRSVGWLRFYVPSPARVSLAIYDVSGRRVRQLVDGSVGAGVHAAALDLLDQSGGPMRDGVYFARLEQNGVVARTMVIVRR